uniref:GM01206p n=1 Tax=Drosophila melanogaster TaxID=7227 RepID=Q95NV2_DROME|nr:GM01206p [Drosophila melanogaster]AAL28399.1 GM03003p [Drosophila melanogaster]
MPRGSGHVRINRTNSAKCFLDICETVLLQSLYILKIKVK